MYGMAWHTRKPHLLPRSPPVASVSWPQVGLQLICVCRPDARLISSRGSLEQLQVFDWEIEMREPLQNFVTNM